MKISHHCEQTVFDLDVTIFSEYLPLSKLLLDCLASVSQFFKHYGLMMDLIILLALLKK